MILKDGSACNGAFLRRPPTSDIRQTTKSDFNILSVSSRFTNVNDQGLVIKITMLDEQLNVMSATMFD